MTSQFLRLVVRPEQDVRRLVTGIHHFGQQQWADRREQRLVAVPATYGRVSRPGPAAAGAADRPVGRPGPGRAADIAPRYGDLPTFVTPAVTGPTARSAP